MGGYKPFLVFFPDQATADKKTRCCYIQSIPACGKNYKSITIVGESSTIEKIIEILDVDDVKKTIFPAAPYGEMVVIANQESQLRRFSRMGFYPIPVIFVPSQKNAGLLGWMLSCARIRNQWGDPSYRSLWSVRHYLASRCY